MLLVGWLVALGCVPAGEVALPFSVVWYLELPLDQMPPWMDARFHALALLAVIAGALALGGYAAGRGMGAPRLCTAAFLCGTVAVARTAPIVFFGL